MPGRSVSSVLAFFLASTRIDAFAKRSDALAASTRSIGKEESIDYDNKSFGGRLRSRMYSVAARGLHAQCVLFTFHF